MIALLLDFDTKLILLNSELLMYNFEFYVLMFSILIK